VQPVDLRANNLRPEPNLAGSSVLIADDDPIILRILGDRCRQLGLDVETATDGLGTLARVNEETPDLLILDLNLPDVDGFKVCEILTDPKYQPLSVIILTATSDAETIRRCESIGAFYIYKDEHACETLDFVIKQIFVERSPSDPNSLVMDGHTQRPTRVLLVEDDQVVMKILAAALQSHGIATITARNGMQGFWLALKEKPDAIITDYHMPGGSGHYLLTRIKRTPGTWHIPVIMFTGRELSIQQCIAMDRDLRGRGQAAAFITKPIDADALLKELRRHLRVPPQVLTAKHQ
jgi:CheY-like chemotaxis protein